MIPKALIQQCVNVAFVASLVYVYVLGRDDAGKDSGTTEKIPLHFTETAKEAGLVFSHVPLEVDPKIKNIEPHVSGLGAAVALVDYDGDGFTDVFTTSSRTNTENALFKNRGDGTFENVTAAVGLLGMNAPGTGFTMGGVFGDLDGDGDVDLYVSKFGIQQLYRNDNGHFVDVTKEAGLDRWMNSASATFFDFDRDGDLDLYACGYFRDEVHLDALTDTKIMQSSFEFANNGGKNRLYRNDGGMKFADVTDEMKAGSTRWTLAVASLDFNGDGWPDLYLANDYGPEELYLNRGGKGFELAKGAGLSDKSKSGMCVAVGDIKNEGKPSVFVTNICRAGYLFQENNLRWNQLTPTGGKFENITNDHAIADCGWAWGAQFGDLDNDGWQDLVVVNGFLSQSPERDYWFNMTKIASALNDSFEDARNWPPIENQSLSGFEKSRVFLNNKGNDFRDVARRAGVTDDLDGRGIALGDLWNRGRLDMVIANRNGPVLLYKNDGALTGHYIQFKLKGRGSNTMAIGACVRITLTSESTCQFVSSASGFAAQNDARLHFGIGNATSVARATIRWPDGHEQVVDSPKVDQLNLIEESAP